jgi:hypothetical protein
MKISKAWSLKIDSIASQEAICKKILSSIAVLA